MTLITKYLHVYRCTEKMQLATNGTADKRWCCHSGHKLRIQILRPRQDYVMSNSDNDGKLADTIYIICGVVDEPTLYAIFSKFFFINIE